MILFRRAVTAPSGFTTYELFAVPSDLSTAPRAIPNTSGMRDRFVLTPDGRTAVAIASPPSGDHGARLSRGQRGAAETCILSLGLAPPFPVKRLACIDGSEQVVEQVISPKGKWAAVSTKRRAEGRGLEWRLRVISLASGKTALDEADVPGLGIRAVSDAGLLVQSGVLGAVARDVPAKTSHELDLPSGDTGHHGFFRNDTELVYLDGGNVRVLDVSH
jgi:hypothetical protein